MPTDDERREVAARLRNETICHNDTQWWPDMTIFGCSIIGGSEVGVYSALNYLADLIEPEERTCRMRRDEYGVWHCSNCDDAERGGEGIVSWCDSWAPDFCPSCGRKVVYK